MKVAQGFRNASAGAVLLHQRIEPLPADRGAVAAREHGTGPRPADLEPSAHGTRFLAAEMVEPGA